MTLFIAYSPFDSCSKLGEGTYGEVFEMKTVDQISVAVKVYSIHYNNVFQHFILFR
jgi:hypothetical protein